MRVLLFAGVRDKAGTDAIELPIDRPVVAAEVIAALSNRFPEAADLIRISRLAVDGGYVGNDHPIDAEANEIALIPPVSGG